MREHDGAIDSCIEKSGALETLIQPMPPFGKAESFCCGFQFHRGARQHFQHLPAGEIACERGEYAELRERIGEELEPSAERHCASRLPARARGIERFQQCHAGRLIVGTR